MVCLGLIQIILTCYSGALTIESLPGHVSESRRRTHRRVFISLIGAFVPLTFLVAKLNDSTQYASELTVQQERGKQELLQAQLRQTLDAVLDSQEKLQSIKQVVDTHAPSVDRSAMLTNIEQIQQNLEAQTRSMRRLETPQ